MNKSKLVKISKHEFRRCVKIGCFNNRKAQVQFFLENAFRIGFLIVALLAFFLLVNFYIKNTVDTTRLQAEVTNARIIYSDAIMYKDPSTNRLYNGIIDLNKFDSSTIDSKIDYVVKRHAAAKLELLTNSNGSVVREIYLNGPQYEILDVLSKSGKGKGSATSYYKIYPVTYKDGDKFYYGTLKIKLLIPNS